MDVNVIGSQIGTFTVNQGSASEGKVTSDAAKNDGSSGFVPDEDCYQIREAPKVLIISNDKCDRSPLPGYRKDADNLEKMWQELGCHVTLHENARCKSMQKYLSDFAERLLTGKETFCAVFILSHGNYDSNKGEVIYGTDEGDEGSVAVDDLLSLFDNKNQNLQEMPKLFVFQCCRGQNKPQGVRKGAVAAAPGFKYEKLPQISDTLVMFAAQMKDVAIVDDDGSWLIKAILEVFQRRHETEHVVDMLTRVNRAVAEREVFSSEDVKLHGVKCMSEIRSTLRYKLFIRKWAG